MLAELAGDWGLLLFRAAWAVLFGLLTLAWTDLSPTGLAILFAAYTSVDGIATSIIAIGTRGAPGFAWLLFEGLVRAGIGIVVFVMPAVMSRHLPALFAAWAALSGIGQFAAASALRRELTGEWPLPVAGALSLIAAGLLTLGIRSSQRDAVWILGPYSIAFGCVVMTFAIRLWRLGREMARV
jgi:uncharacterized membrane protein HdeD (DUF308 family)